MERIYKTLFAFIAFLYLYGLYNAWFNSKYSAKEATASIIIPPYAVYIGGYEIIRSFFFISIENIDDNKPPKKPNWVLISQEDETDISVDKNSIRDVPDGYKKAWILFEDFSPRGNNVSYRISSIYFSCRNKIFSPRMSYGYDNNNKIVETQKLNPDQFILVNKNTPVEKMLNFVCNYK